MGGALERVERNEEEQQWGAREVGVWARLWHQQTGREGVSWFFRHQNCIPTESMRLTSLSCKGIICRKLRGLGIGQEARDPFKSYKIKLFSLV